MKETRLLELLADHGIKANDLTPQDMDRLGDGGDEETAMRIIRVAAVNKTLRQRHWCVPLTMAETEKPKEEAEPETEQDLLHRTKLGLQRDEWDNIKGQHGSVLGFGLSQKVYMNLLKTCRTKQALALRNNVEKSKEFLMARIQMCGVKSNRRPKKVLDAATVLEKKSKAIVRLAARGIVHPAHTIADGAPPLA